jgi:ElaB/YqjD/DUF883 family membrane-anchored ribosome-binding protein
MQTQEFNDLSTDTGSAGGTPPSTRATGQKIDRAAQTAHETVDRVHQKATELTDRATTEGDRMYQAACNWISAHPMQAVLGALAVGYLYGRIRA